MKKLFRYLPLITTSLMAFLPASLEASVSELDPTAVEQRIGLRTSENLTPENTVHNTHEKILQDLKAHWQKGKVAFSYGEVDYIYQEGHLTLTPKGSYKITASEESVGKALDITIEEWIQQRQNFLEGYFDYRRNARDASLLEAVNQRYAEAPISAFRYTNLDNALDAHCLLEMHKFIARTKQEATKVPLPITERFKTEDNVNFLKLAAATLRSKDYTPAIKADVRGHVLDQIAFRSVFSNLLRSNADTEALRANFSSLDRQLPVCKDASYQELLGAEACLAMVMFQKYLVHPEDVLALFTANKEALKTEQDKYATSGLIKERNRDLLATNLARGAVRKNTCSYTGLALTEAEADRYIATNDGTLKAAIVAEATERLAKAEEEAEKETAKAKSA